MKKFFFFGLSMLSILGYFACIKSGPTDPVCTPMPVASDSAALLQFAGDSIKLTKDVHGLYYHIIDSGKSDPLYHPVFSSNVTVTYVAKLMNHKTIDSADNTNLGGASLNKLIPAWQIALPKIGVGGRIQIFAPSALAYGCTGYQTIPANSPLYFDVKLISFY